MAKRRERLALRGEKVVSTLEKLQARIEERFPQAGLGEVCAELARTARHTPERARRLAQPYLALRFLTVLAAVAAIAAQGYILSVINWRSVSHADPVGLTQGLQSGVNLILLAASAIFFLLNLETRLKRSRTLRALYELRSIAHVIDMHQLTKDPTVILSGFSPTGSSPKRQMNQFQLSRYLDYCSEMLALVAKLAAVYAERTEDPVVIAAVNDLEELTSSLGRKIWQKIMILNQLDERAAK